MTDKKQVNSRHANSVDARDTEHIEETGKGNSQRFWVEKVQRDLHEVQSQSDQADKEDQLES